MHTEVLGKAAINIKIVAVEPVVAEVSMVVVEAHDVMEELEVALDI